MNNAANCENSCELWDLVVTHSLNSLVDPASSWGYASQRCLTIRFCGAYLPGARLAVPSQGLFHHLWVRGASLSSPWKFAPTCV